MGHHQVCIWLQFRLLYTCAVRYYVAVVHVCHREHAPSIIFMDEVDSIGSARTENSGGGGDSEVQRTMLELLNQLDGFEASNKIKVRQDTHLFADLDLTLKHMPQTRCVLHSLHPPHTHTQHVQDPVCKHCQWPFAASGVGGVSGAPGDCMAWC